MVLQLLVSETWPTSSVTVNLLFLLRHISPQILLTNSKFYGFSLPLPPAAAYDECSPVTADKGKMQLVSTWDETEKGLFDIKVQKQRTNKCGRLWVSTETTQSRVCGMYVHWIEDKRACITTKWSQSEQSAGHRKDQYLTFIDMNSTWTHSDRLSGLWVLNMRDLMVGMLSVDVTVADSWDVSFCTYNDYLQWFRFEIKAKLLLSTSRGSPVICSRIQQLRQ